MTWIVIHEYIETYIHEIKVRHRQRFNKPKNDAESIHVDNGILFGVFDDQRGVVC